MFKTIFQTKKPELEKIKEKIKYRFRTRKAKGGWVVEFKKITHFPLPFSTRWVPLTRLGNLYYVYGLKNIYYYSAVEEANKNKDYFINELAINSYGKQLNKWKIQNAD